MTDNPFLLEPFKDFKLIEKPFAESYTFRGNSFVHWFNITFVSGRIIITGDCGDNVFIMGGSNEELKHWLYEVDKDYALSKSRQTKEYYDSEYAKQRLIEDLQEYEHPPKEIKIIVEQLDFTTCELLMESISNLNGRDTVFSNWWEMERIFRIWSPYQEMQYKQLRFAGEWLAKNEGI